MDIIILSVHGHVVVVVVVVIVHMAQSFQLFCFKVEMGDGQ